MDRTVLFLGLLVIVGLCLRPPHQWTYTTYLINSDNNALYRGEASTADAGHHWIWSPPQGKGWECESMRTSRNANIDWGRFGVYAVLALAVALFGSLIVAGDRKKPDQ